jgi:F0F1-type ATP synthase assembly protein I
MDLLYALLNFIGTVIVGVFEQAGSVLIVMLLVGVGVGIYAIVKKTKALFARKKV